MRKYAATLLFLLVITGAAAAQTTTANEISCGDLVGQPLVKIPEIVSSDGVLNGTLYTVSEQVRMATGAPATAKIQCQPQWVRAYRATAPSTWNPTSQDITYPLPGPTLRARLGDIVQLTFLNVIDPTKFHGVDDNKCDQTSVYPVPNGGPDVYPDCFAGSVFTNVHYHGSHTNPNTTGDNVFLQIRPANRAAKDNAPTVNAETVRASFDEFFAQCRAELQKSTGPKIWPRIWSDLPESTQKTLLDPVKPIKEWYAADLNLIANGDWPQYFVGAYPYCFKVPKYVPTTKTAGTASADVRTPHTHGAGQAEVDESKAPQRPLIMGQAPGTHWYHAHKHGSTTINVSNGMTGTFIVEGEYDDELNAYYGKGWTRQQPVIVIQQLGGSPGLMTFTGANFTGPGPRLSVNGRINPVITMPGNSVAMWRVANNSGRAGVMFEKPTGLQWKQLAQDGVQFNDVNYQKALNQEILLASGNRADLLVKAPAFQKVAEGATGPDPNVYDVKVLVTVDPTDRPPLRPQTAVVLMTVRVTENGSDMAFIPHAPSFPTFLRDIGDDEISGTKIVKFASSRLGTGAPPPASQHTIDGKLFDGELGAVVALNRAEEWKVVNETFPPANLNQISHPFHIHINPFQISELFDPNTVLSEEVGRGTVTLEKVTDAKGNVTNIVHGDDKTTFLSTFMVGDWILIGTVQPAVVAKITDDQTMTINLTRGAITTPTAYRSAIPLYTIDGKNKRANQCALNPDDPSTWKPCTPAVPDKNRIWWDVFSIPSGNTFYRADGSSVQIPGYFKMRSRFVDYPGYFVIHCHILAHEDRGMMTVVEVAPLQTPYSHH